MLIINSNVHINCFAVMNNTNKIIDCFVDIIFKFNVWKTFKTSHVLTKIMINGWFGKTFNYHHYKINV